MDQDSLGRSTPRPPAAGGSDEAWADSPRKALLARHPWLLFVLPFAVYMLVGSLEPTPPKPDAVAGEQATASSLGIRFEHYPLIYTTKIALTIAAMWFVAPGYGFRFRISPIAVVVGAVGVVQLERLNDPKALQRACVEAGIWVRPFRDIVYLTPSFTMTAEDLGRVTGALRKVLAA